MTKTPKNLLQAIAASNRDPLHKQLHAIFAEYATGLERFSCHPEFAPSNKADDIVWRGGVLAEMINAPHNL